MIRAPRPGGRRRGISLLEVLIALAIFVMALVALSQIVQMAASTAADLERQSRAVLLCKSKLDAVAAGVIPLQSQGDEPFDDDPDWVWSLDCEPRNDISNLWTVKVTVRRSKAGQSRVEYTLTQLVFDPAQRGTNLDVHNTQNSSSSSSGRSGGTNGAAGAGGN